MSQEKRNFTPVIMDKKIKQHSKFTKLYVCHVTDRVSLRSLIQTTLTRSPLRYF